MSDAIGHAGAAHKRSQHFRSLLSPFRYFLLLTAVPTRSLASSDEKTRQVKGARPSIGPDHMVSFGFQPAYLMSTRVLGDS